MKLHELQPTEGSRKSRKRVGRGPGSGVGKTAGRGQKGQKARAGGGVRPGFEGGQMPLIQRVPKRGFNNPTKKDYAIINLEQLSRFAEGTEVSPKQLQESGVIKKQKDGVKVLGNGELNVSLTVRAHKFSASAREAIENAGGKVEVI